MNISICELNTWKPIAKVLKLTEEPVLILLRVRPGPLGGVSALPSLIPISICIRLASRNAEDGPHCPHVLLLLLHLLNIFLLSSWLIWPRLVLVGPLVGLVSGILRIILSWVLVLLSLCAISLSLSISVAVSGTYLLPAHRTVLAAVLDELDRAELVEEVAAGQPSGRHHLVLAYGAVFELVDLSLLISLPLGIGLEAQIGAILLLDRCLLLVTLLDDEIDERKVSLKPVHEFSKLPVLLNVSVHFHTRLNQLISENAVIEDAQVEASDDHQEREVQQVDRVCAEVQDELALDQINFCFIVVFDATHPVRCESLAVVILKSKVHVMSDHGLCFLLHDTVLLEVEAVLLAEDFRAEDVHQAIIRRWDVLLDLVGRLRDDAHCFRVPQLANHSLLQLCDLDQRREGWVGQEDVLRQREARNQLRQTAGLLKVPQ